MENQFDFFAPMCPRILDKSISEDIDKALCQLKWNSVGTRIDWSAQSPHKFIKFGSGVELGELKEPELSEFNVFRSEDIVVIFSADESAFLIKKEALLKNWELLDFFVATRFFLIPYQDVVDMKICNFIECDPISFMAGHI